MPSALRTGRFAPSPTGPLHIGSLIAALASCLEARAQSARWLVRIEDVDSPRCLPGMGDEILRQLEAFGFEWDGPVIWQSQRLEAYHAALDALRAAGHVYPCGCSRREVADSALRAADGAPRYPGTCRQGLAPARSARAWRLCTAGAAPQQWHDAVQGPQQEDVESAVGDFVLLRADGLFAYQLAVVVDDAWQGVTDIVRGADLLGSTGRQLLLLQKLGVPAPHYAHLPVATNAAGEKLSKQTLAAPLDAAHPAGELWRALDFLGQQPPAELRNAPLAQCWQWMRAHWQLAAVPRSLGSTIRA